MRFRVNSRASNVVIGIAMIPAVVLLCLAFSMFERGQVWFGVAAAVGFLAILMPAGLVARRLSRQIEVDEIGMREVHRSGRVVEIRWSEPHELQQRTVVVRKTLVPISGTIFVTLTAAERVIKFSTPARAGLLGVATRLPGATELRDGADAVARAVELSAAARRSA